MSIATEGEGVWTWQADPPGQPVAGGGPAMRRTCDGMDVFLGAVCDAVWWAASRLTHSTPQRRGPDRTTGIGMCAWCFHARGLATAYVPLELSVDGGPYRTEYLFPSQHAGDTFTERGGCFQFPVSRWRVLDEAWPAI